MLDREVRFRRALHGADQFLGELRVGAAGERGGNHAGQHAHADQERLLVADDAGAVERILEIGGAVELGGNDGRDLFGARQIAQHARIEHGIEYAAAAAQNARQPRRGAHDVGDEPQQLGVGAQQREQLNARRQLGQETVEARKRGAGRGRVGQRLDQQGLHLRQALARLGAAHGGVAAVMPAAHRRDHLGGLLVAELGQGFHGRGIVGLAGEHHVVAAAREVGAVLEQRRVVPLYGLQHRQQRGRQLGGAGIAGKPRERCQLGFVLRQLMRLLVGDHLHAMLDGAQDRRRP